MESKIWYLKNADLFSWMSPEEIEQLKELKQRGLVETSYRAIHLPRPEALIRESR